MYMDAVCLVLTICYCWLHVKVNLTLSPTVKAQMGTRYIVLLFLLPRRYMGVGVLTPRPGRFTPGERDPVPIVQEAGWAPGPVRTGADNLAPHVDSIVEPSSL
jgi:hypothetical protein